MAQDTTYVDSFRVRRQPTACKVCGKAIVVGELAYMLTQTEGLCEVVCSVKCAQDFKEE